MNNTIKTLPNGDFEVIKDAPSSDLLESDKPTFNPDDKHAKKLFCDVQDAYDTYILSKSAYDRHTLAAASAGIIPSEDVGVKLAFDAYTIAFETYDDAVDTIVEAFNGQAPAFWTDPMTCDQLEAQGVNTRDFTYNELAELIGGIGFGD